MTLLANEQILDFDFNLPPEAFDNMKNDMRLFGDRCCKAMEIDLPLAELLKSTTVKENIFNYQVEYNLEYISSIHESILFGVMSYFSPDKMLIRVDTETISDNFTGDSILQEKHIVENLTNFSYKDIILQQVLFHEKMHLLFQKNN